MIDLRAKRGLVVRIANEHSIATGTLLHSIAYAPAADLHGRMTDCSAAGFALAMDVSCHALRRMARLADPLMPHAGCNLADHSGVWRPAFASVTRQGRLFKKKQQKTLGCSGFGLSGEAQPK